jgi:uncharacterized protein YndB with AHSA1/START domain
MSGGRPEEGVISARTDANGLEIVRIFDAPRELVYQAWTEPESATMIYGPEETEIPSSGEFRELSKPQRVVMTLDNPEGLWS